MDKVKAALTDFTHRAGHSDTTVHEAVAPAVQHEVVKPHVHEEIVTAVDKEVHQDHYHRTVQPIQDREVLPEVHTAKLGEVQHREFDHRDHDSTKRNLIVEQSQFKDERIVEATTHSRSVAPVVGGEHIHHHIHETIQPVVQKEVIQPTVIHTTVPIHEVHHNAATHHSTTALPAMTMDQFKAKGGVLSGREERYDEFQGVPKNIGGSTAGLVGSLTGQHSSDNARHGDYNSGSGLTGSHGTTGGLGSSGTHGMLDSHNSHAMPGGVGSGLTGGLSGSTSGHHGHGVGSVGGVGAGLSDDSHTKAKLDHRPGEDSSLPKALTEDVSRAQPHSSLDDNRHGHHDMRNTHDTIGHNTNVGQGTTGHNSTSSSSTSGKPSLMDKLNPKVDANGDGKAGFMK